MNVKTLVTRNTNQACTIDDINDWLVVHLSETHLKSVDRKAGFLLFIAPRVCERYHGRCLLCDTAHKEIKLRDGMVVDNEVVRGVKPYISVIKRLVNELILNVKESVRPTAHCAD